MNDDDITYFKRREQEERQRADSCAEIAIARVHLQMADGYKNALQAAAPFRVERSAISSA